MAVVFVVVVVVAVVVVVVVVIGHDVRIGVVFSCHRIIMILGLGGS